MSMSAPTAPSGPAPRTLLAHGPRSVTVSSLSPGSTYHYRILCYFEQMNDGVLYTEYTADQITDGAFTTPPAGTGTASFQLPALKGRAGYYALYRFQALRLRSRVPPLRAAFRFRPEIISLRWGAITTQAGTCFRQETGQSWSCVKGIVRAVSVPFGTISTKWAHCRKSGGCSSSPNPAILLREVFQRQSRRAIPSGGVCGSCFLRCGSRGKPHGASFRRLSQGNSYSSGDLFARGAGRGFRRGTGGFEKPDRIGADRCCFLDDRDLAVRLLGSWKSHVR